MLTAKIAAMTSPRRNLFEPGQAGAYHCVSRCVRRAWLCGIDSYTGESFEHRKPIVEARVQKLGEIFAVGIHTYRVMSNHVHIVFSVAAKAAYDWPDEEIARRWRLWEGRFKCEVLLKTCKGSVKAGHPEFRRNHPTPSQSSPSPTPAHHAHSHLHRHDLCAPKPV